MLIALGGLLGLSAIIIGAAFGHRADLPPESAAAVGTALQYHLINAVLITATGFSQAASSRLAESKLLTNAGLSFVVGTLLFSGMIYLNRIAGISAVSFLTPVGGILQMVGWALLILAGIRLKSAAATKPQ